MSRKDNKGRKLKDGESQRPNGTYCYRYTDKFKKRRAIYAKDLRTLREKEEQVIKGEISFGSPSIKEMTLADYLEMYIHNLHLKKIQTEKTYLSHVKRVKLHSIASMKICDLTKPMCKEYASWLSKNYADTTVKTECNFIKQALRYAVEEDILPSNPFDFRIRKMLSGRVVRPAIALTDEEFDSLVGEMRQSKVYQYYVPHFIFLRETGLRISEFCVLTDDDVDFNSRMLRVNKQIVTQTGPDPHFLDTPKTESSNTYIPLTPTALDAVRQIMEYTSDRQSLSTRNGETTTTGIFVLTKKHTLFNNSVWEQIFRRVTHFYHQKHPDSSLVVRPHTLRHTTANRLLEKGLSVPSTQRMLRHSSPVTTLKIYTHFTENTLQNELDNLFMNDEQSLGIKP